MTAPTLALIAAVAENGVIGDGGRMPWRLSSDLRRFKALTLGKPVVMGRKTFEAIGKPLVGRTNIVVSRDRSFAPQGVTVRDGLTAALDLALGEAGRSGDGEAMVIGGGEIYAATIGKADRLYITHVAARPAGDVHFPAIDPAAWRIAREERLPAGEHDSAATRFVVYERERAGGR